MASGDDRNELVTTQEKLEWVTPQISLLLLVPDTEGKVRSPTEFTISVGAS